MSAREEPAALRSAAGLDRTSGAAAVLATCGAAAAAFAPTTPTLLAGLSALTAGSALAPSAGLIVLAATLPFYLYPKSVGPMLFSVPELVLLSTLAGALLHVGYRGLRGARPHIARLSTPLDVPVALFLAAALLSLLASEVPRVSLRDLRTLILEPIAAFYLAAWFLRRTHAPWMLAALVAGGTAAALLGIAQYFFTSYSVAVEGTVRMLGPYLSPNQLALYMGRVLPLALAALLFVPKLRPASGIAFGITLAAAALTFSVGGWLAIGLAVCTVVLLWRPRVLPALFATAAVLAVASYPILTTERFASHLSPATGTSFIRLQVWESSIRMILDHPILGVGMDNFLYLYRSAYLLPGAIAEPNLSHPHNLILNFWLQIGILGLAAFIGILVVLSRVWIHLWRRPHSPVSPERAASDGPAQFSTEWSRAALAGIAGVAVDFVAHGLVDNSYFLVDMAFNFWLLTAVLVILATPPLEPDDQPNPPGRVRLPTLADP